MAFIMSYCMAIILVNIFQCTPIRQGWDFYEHFFGTGHCVLLQGINVATGALNIVSDIAILVVPIPSVLRLHLPPVKVIGVLAILATAILYGNPLILLLSYLD